MELHSTPVFDKDVKKLDKSACKLVQQLIEKIRQQPQSGKPLRHYANAFSQRTGHKRLIYLVKLQEGKILLALYKNRDDVYDALKGLNLSMFKF